MSESTKANISCDSAKIIYKKVLTVANECLHEAFAKALEHTWGKSWLDRLAAECKVDVPASVYEISFSALLTCLSSENDLSRAVADYFSCSPDTLYVKSKKINEFLPKLSSSDVQAEIWYQASLDVASLVDLFPSLRDFDGETFVSKAFFRSAKAEMQEHLPTYQVEAFIAEKELELSTMEFVECCISSGAYLTTYDDVLCFSTSDYSPVLAQAHALMDKKSKKAETQDKKRLFIKIAAITIAVVIALLSALITNKITVAVLENKGNGGQNSVSSPTPDSNKTDAGTLLKTAQALLNSSSPTSTAKTSTPSPSPTPNLTPVVKTTSASGRVTETAEVPFRYDGVRFNSYNSDVAKQEAINLSFQAGLAATRINKKEVYLNIGLTNSNEYMIRNISIHLDFIGEDGKSFMQYTVDKLTDDDTSVSINGANSYYFSEDLTDKVNLPADFDASFFTLKTTFSYDVVE